MEVLKAPIGIYRPFLENFVLAPCHYILPADEPKQKFNAGAQPNSRFSAISTPATRRELGVLLNVAKPTSTLPSQRAESTLILGVKRRTRGSIQTVRQLDLSTCSSGSLFFTGC